MAKKRKTTPDVEDVTGWVLICRDEDSPEWRIAWTDPFSSKKAAIGFAVENNWPGPYRAVRGRLTVAM